MKKYVLPYLLVLGGLALVIIYGWQLAVGVVLMLCGGLVWKLTREGENKTPPPQKK